MQKVRDRKRENERDRSTDKYRKQQKNSDIKDVKQT